MNRGRGRFHRHDPWSAKEKRHPAGLSNGQDGVPVRGHGLFQLADVVTPYWQRSRTSFCTLPQLRVDLLRHDTILRDSQGGDTEPGPADRQEPPSIRLTRQHQRDHGPFTEAKRTLARAGTKRSKRSTGNASVRCATHWPSSPRLRSSSSTVPSLTGWPSARGSVWTASPRSLPRQRCGLPPVAERTR